MSECRTLKEIADEVGYPFDCQTDIGYVFHAVAMTPYGRIIGWGLGSSNPDSFDANTSQWKLIEPEKEMPGVPADYTEAQMQSLSHANVSEKTLSLMSRYNYQNICLRDLQSRVKKLEGR